jgi:hypothetical protein
MTNPAAIPAPTSNYADCLEAIRDRLAARESRLFGIAVLVVYVHQVEQLYANAGQANAARMLDELRNRLSQVNRPGDYFARLGAARRPATPAGRGPWRRSGSPDRAAPGPSAPAPAATSAGARRAAAARR